VTRTEDDLRAAYHQPPDPAALTRLRAFVGQIDELGEVAKPVARTRRRRGRWLAPMIAAVAVVAVFTTIAVIGRSSLPNSAGAGGQSSKALRLWADFPVDASPRPLVLAGPDIVDPATGFPNGDDKEAYIYGRFELKTTLPAGPAIVNGQPVISAAEALAVLRSQGHGEKPPKPTSLMVTSAKLGTADFPTDRGVRSLPAWVFRFAGVSNPAMVLAIPATDRWPRPGMPVGNGGEGSVTISKDGSQVTLSFVGAAPGTGPCQAEYAADVSQSATAVSISPRELPGHGDGQENCDAVGHLRTVTATLKSPLGNRVVVNPQGVPLPAR
jgi:hypothetical protein